LSGFAACLWPAFGGRKSLKQNKFGRMNIKGMSETTTFRDWQYLGSQADEFHTLTNLFFFLFYLF